VSARIVGISLVRDEDLFVEQALRNVLDFCDELILVDHRSRDGTGAIFAQLSAEHPGRVTVHSVKDPSSSHDLVASLAGEPVWVFAVDGDELYDPERLREFRPLLLSGEFDEWWLIRANALHTLELDDDRRTARGYLAPPAPSMVKLHNFALIESWGGRHTERLHGTEGLRFKPGNEPRKLELHKLYGWDDSPLRCLHLCFLRRSTRERKARARVNIPDLNIPRRAPQRLLYRARASLGLAQSAFKLEHYRQGDLVSVDASPFFQLAREAPPQVEIVAST
jgi:glycosyltransferase involved in cell wall biosynthesis